MTHSTSGEAPARVQRRAYARSAEGAPRARPSDHVLAMVIGAIALAVALVLIAAPSAE